MDKKYYLNYFKTDYTDKNIIELFNKDSKKFFEIILTFYSPENIEFNFSLLDSILFFSIFKKKSIQLYKDIHCELRKRKIILLEKDFNLLFSENIILLYKYINKYFIIEKRKLNKFFYVNYTSENFLIKNTNKPLKISENKVNFKISNFEKFNLQEQFEKIFDLLIDFKYESYKEFMINNRKKYILESNFIDFFKEKNINTYKYQKLSSKNTFYIKGKKRIKFIDIYVGDISKNNFNLLFKIISILFKGKYYKIRMKKTFDEFKKITSKNKINLFLCNENINIYPIWWINENRYILSIKDLKNDLILLFTKNLNKKFLILKTNNTLQKKDIIHFYNTHHYVSRRVNAFIEFLKEE